MLCCFKNSAKNLTETFPTVTYSVYWRYKGGNITPAGGVYELREDAQAYCDAHQTADYVYSYVQQQFVPPYDLNQHYGWPTYAYPMYWKDSHGTMNTTSLCFASANDAEDYMLSHTTDSVHYMYSDQYYYPASTKVLSNSRSGLFKEAIAPASIVYVPEHK